MASRMGLVMVDLRGVDVRELDLEEIVVPVLNLNGAATVDWKLRFQRRDYAYNSSIPIKGYGATLPGRVREALDEGHQALLVERADRYYLYLTEPVSAEG